MEHEPRAASRPDRRAALCFALGAAAAVLARGRSSRVSARDARAAALWVADRDGGALHGLDAALCPVRGHAVRGPVRVAVAATGALWAAGEEPRAGRLWLWRCGEDGPSPVAELAGRACSLSAHGDGVLLALRTAGGRCEWSAWSDAGPGWRLAGPATLRAVAVGPRALHAADEEGRLWRLHGRSFEPVGRLPESVLDLAPAAEGGLWVLCEARALRLDARLAPGAEVALEAPAELLARSGARGGTWAVGARLGALRLRPDGRAGARVRHLPAPGARAALELPDGGLLVLAAGALLAFDARGRPRPGQGGFERAVDLAPDPLGPLG